MANETDAQHVHWEDREWEQMGPIMKRRFAWGERLMVAQIEMFAGGHVPQHRHDNEQITNVLEGRLEFRFGEDGSDVRIVGTGDSVVIPSNLPHEVFGCLFLDTRHRLIRYEELFRGTVDGAAVYPREVLKRSLHHNGTAVIIGHNHYWPCNKLIGNGLGLSVAG